MQEKLINASKTINSTLELDEVLDRILLTATENVKADRGTIYLLDEPSGEIRSKVLLGEEKLEIRLPVGRGLAGFVAQTGETIILDDAYSDPRFNQDVDKKSGYKTESLLTTPMRNKEGKIIGVFQLLNKLDGLFSQEDVTFLDALSTHAAIALENAFLLQESLEKKELEKELEVAGGIQKQLLPADSPEIEGFELLGDCTPCETVGGDSYDFIPLGKGKPVHRDVVYELEQYPEDKTEKDLERHVAPASRRHMQDFLVNIMPVLQAVMVEELLAMI